ncbi:hypothetical protein F7R91_27730 [Streptomyces luteolifulvus]|jgi:hypothetical protein|uniref:Uncharacterized protein n=1 Tax=Streptomyces luteolifulvus TaxID=2615112 RepID=A0A6H9UUW0_9ACTN|nr:DUF6082 family protein [Streptomyces luteolifulvus]KAB1142891.1 hypothetical protein F7R91_27730 [Streptomyces luteolifulvus]
MAGLAFAAGAFAALAVQRLHGEAMLLARLELMHEEQRQHHWRTDMADKHRLHFDLLCKAVQDPDLAAVLDTYEIEITPTQLKQYLFANALYGNLLHAFRSGTVSLEEALGHMRGICQSSIFREYWEVTGHHRESLPAGSQERLLARHVDEIVARANDENDQWWVA